MYYNNSMNKKEFYKKLHYEKKNWLHENGRVNSTTEGTNWVGVSISPYMKDFQSQIDPGIWPLVKELINKQYLPCSSCEAHDWKEEAFVVICFGSEESRNRFAQQMIKATIPQYRIFFQESQININVYNPFTKTEIITEDPTTDESQNWFKINDEIYWTDGHTKIDQNVLDRETENWNYCFGRKYKKWYFCRILIGGAIIQGYNPKTLFVHYTRRFWIKRLAKFVKEKMEHGYD